MTSPTKRQPLPALVFILVLCLLAALVWWRVLHRDSPKPQGQATCTAQPLPKLTVVPKPAAVTVTVLNSTQRNGLGAGVATALKADGFQVPAKAANDPTAVTGVAEIRFGPTGEAAAALLAYYVPGAKLVTTDSTAATVVLSLGAQYTALAKPAAVAAKMRTDGVTYAASGTPTPPATSSC